MKEANGEKYSFEAMEKAIEIMMKDKGYFWCDKCREWVREFATHKEYCN